MKRIKAGSKFWIVGHFPVGGIIRRTHEPIILVKIENIIDYGDQSLLIGLTEDGRKVAVAPDCIEESAPD